MSSINENFYLSIQDGDQVLEAAVQYLSAACISQWLQKSPSAKATLFMNDVGGFTFMPTLFFLAYLIHQHHAHMNQKLFHYLQSYCTAVHGASSLSYRFGWLRVSQQPQCVPPRAVDLSGLVKNMLMPKLYRDIFFVVLKKTTLFLYDSERQLDCKGVLQMQACKVMMHPPGLKDHELFNRPQLIKIFDTLNGSTYYLNCHRPTDKEDWYHALLRASASASVATPGETSDLHAAAIHRLITTIHSDPCHIEFQWFNALIGRLFCGIHQTERVRALLYNKLVSKLDRINRGRPHFLGPITVRSVDPGFAQPYLTRPRLLHLTPRGELVAEACVDYGGHLKFEIETMFQWQYAEQFKPLRVRIVLAITLRSLNGSLRLTIKAPPTNRIWYGFYHLPEMDWLVEPVIWERRLGYSMVVNAIKTKIQEAVMRNAVLPNQDDITFFPTVGAQGGIFI
ncbi:putative integral membrane protein conserved region-domain-containing protein [Dichotomocladium elegans]|nr:putative integral membrane protein conserved region-domain-containing protein [Dichotomocladium elegans]